MGERTVTLSKKSEPAPTQEPVEVPDDSIKVSAKSLAIINQVMSRSETEPGQSFKPEFTYSQSSLKILKEIKADLNDIKQSLKENVQEESASAKECAREIIASYPAALKYEELLLPQRVLMVPVNLKHVLRIAGALDAVLNYYKARGKAQVFDELRKSIESTYHMNFTVALFEKLLEIAPEFYTHNWVLLEKRRSFSLIIDIPHCFPQVLDHITNGEVEEAAELLSGSEEGMSAPMDTSLMERRADVLRLRVIEITSRRHREFLKSISEEAYDPFKHKTWHHLFKVHDVDVEGRRLRDKPEMRRSLGVGEFIKRNSIKDQLVKAALEEVAKDTSKEDPDSLTDSSLKGVLSDLLIKKIKAKESAIRKTQKLLDESEMESKGRTEQARLLNRCNAIMAIFITSGWKAMLMDELVKRLQDDERGNFCGAETLIADVETLVEQVPSWIKKVQAEKGVFIKVDRKVSMDIVKNAIEKGK